MTAYCGITTSFARSGGSTLSDSTAPFRYTQVTTVFLGAHSLKDTSHPFGHAGSRWILSPSAYSSISCVVVSMFAPWSTSGMPS